MTAVLRYDRDYAVRLFLILAEAREDRLFTTYYVERFLGYTLRTHFKILLPILERMMSSTVSEVATAGARRACIAALFLEDAMPHARKCLGGSESQRLGAAEVFSANLREAPFRRFCEEALVRLFGDDNEKVRSEAASCFHGLEAVGLKSYAKLVEKFTVSKAFGDAPYPVIHALIEDTAALPEATCLVCERFGEMFGSEARTIQTRAGGEASRVSQLLVRVYSQTTDRTVQERCLDLVDSMAAAGVLGLDEALVQYER